MRFLIDECTGLEVGYWLRNLGYDVLSVKESAEGLDDASIIIKAFNENRILITNDKDFGEKVFRENFPHCGIVLLRLDNNLNPFKIRRLHDLFERYLDLIPNNFIVVTDNKIRISKN